MGTVKVVRVLSAALDEAPHDSKKLILRGVIDQETLDALLADGYQREALPINRKNTIMDALSKGESLPDIELGMRGDSFKESKDATGIEVVTLLGKVHIIDGLQRVTAAREFLRRNPDAKLRIGAVIHFNTTEEWEKNRFRVLNLLRLPVSPNVILRNMRDSSKAMGMIYDLTVQDKTFVLHDRTAWGQRMARKDIITALGLVKSVGFLHSHKAGPRGSKVEDIVRGLDKLIDLIGVRMMKSNTKYFFDLVDECYGIRRVHYKESALHMRVNFLKIFARVLSDHPDFWKGEEEKELFVEAPIRRKLAQFPMSDPNVVNLAGSGGKSQEILYNMIVNHINSGKRTKRLKSRYAVLSLDTVPEEEGEETED